jgi:membrane protein required for colicin V production
VSFADWIILIVVAASAAEATRSGFFQEAFHLAGLVVGYLLAAWKYHVLAESLASYLKSSRAAEIVAFLAIFVGVLIVAGLAGRIARWAMKESGLSILDRIFGAVIGMLKGGLVVAVVLMSMTAFTPTSKWLENSQLAAYFLVLGRAAIWVAPAELRARFYQGLDLLHQQHAPGQMGTGSSAPGR